MKLLTLAFVFILLLTGCRTTRTATTEIQVHDTAFVYRDSIIYHFVKDSLSEREKTTIETKHDTVNNVDTVYITTEREKFRIVQKRDTVFVTKYVYRSKNDKSTKENAKTRKGHGWLYAGIVFLIIALLCSIRGKK